jgi:2'-5' RNA ligase
VLREPRWRVFFALWPDAVARDCLTTFAQDVVKVAGGRVAPAANMHLTLAFVGDVARARVAALREIGAAVARDAAPFTLVLDRVGGFRDAGIAWIGSAATPAELDGLVRPLRQRLGAGGYPVERRPFHPHVTLVRRCGKPPRDAAAAPIEWRVERLTLMASDLRPDGSEYRELAGWPLAATS